MHEVHCGNFSLLQLLIGVFAFFQVSDASGSMKVTLVKEENPFLQSDLLSDECFILDHGKNKMIFVWKGNKTIAI